MSNIVSADGDRLPSVAARFAALTSNSDLTGGVGQGGYPTISYKGKVWTIVQGDNRETLVNDEGDPKASIDVVILKSNPALSKIYYSGGYEEGSAAKPDCYSNDSITPAADAQSPQATKCSICPHNAWGSRITDSGGKGKSCSDSRRLAVAPINDLENPMLLRIPAGSLKDLVTYADMLSRRKAPYQALITKIKFDHTVAYPKFDFKATRWLSDAEADTALEVMDRDIVARIAGMDEAPLAIAGTPPQAAKRVQAPVEEEEYVAPPKKVAPAPAPAPKPKPKPAPAPVEDEEEEYVAPKPRVKSSISDLMAEADQSLDDVLGMLDD